MAAPKRTHLIELWPTLALSPYNATMQVLDARAGVVRAMPQRHKVALVAASGGRDEAPYRDDSWEVWALNAVPPLDYTGTLRCDRWFELHERHAQSAEDLAWVKACPVPLYLPPAWAEAELAKPVAAREAPTAVRYPLEAVEKRWGSYFACTFAYQMALALLEGVTDLGLYGVELAGGTMRERTVEWACVSWWLGLAEGLGVQVHLPRRSTLARHGQRYGIEYDAEKALVERYVARMAEADRRQEEREGVGG